MSRNNTNQNNNNGNNKGNQKKKEKIYTVEAAVASTEMEINDDLAVAKELVAKATVRKKTFEASKKVNDRRHPNNATLFIIIGLLLFTAGFVLYHEWDCLLGKYMANILWILSGVSTIKATYHLIKGNLK